MLWAAGLKSCTAILAATTEPGPLMSAYRLDMSFSTPSFTVIGFCACAAVPSSRASENAKLPTRRIKTSLSVGLFRPSPKCISDSQIFVQLSHIGLQRGGREMVHDAAMFHHIVTIGNSRGEIKVLLDQEYGESLRLERPDRSPDLLDDDRRQTFGRLVEQQQPGAGAQDARDGQHLLLAAGQFGALAGQPFAQVRKQLENALEIEAAGLELRRQQQIFAHVEAGKDAALLGA